MAAPCLPKMPPSRLANAYKELTSVSVFPMLSLPMYICTYVTSSDSPSNRRSCTYPPACIIKSGGLLLLMTILMTDIMPQNCSKA